MHPTAVKHDDTGDMAIWVIVVGANHGGAEGPPKLEVEEDRVLATTSHEVGGYPSAWKFNDENTAKDALLGVMSSDDNNYTLKITTTWDSKHIVM
jgi:hypothetical protein